MNLGIEDFQKILREIIEGKTLRSIEREYGINRETIVKEIRNLFPENSKDGEKFEKILEYNEREVNSVDISKEVIKDLSSRIFNREITLIQASNILRVDIQTLKSVIEKYVIESNDENVMKQYIKYENERHPDYSHINFKALLIKMIKENTTQTSIAREYDIPTRTIGREIEKLKNDEYYKDLYDLCKECAFRHEHKQGFSYFELELMKKVLEKYDEGTIIITNSKTKEERKYERARKIIEIAEKNEGTNKEKAHKAGVSESTLRRMKKFVNQYEKKQEMKKEGESK